MTDSSPQKSKDVDEKPSSFGFFPYKKIIIFVFVLLLGILFILYHRQQNDKKSPSIDLHSYLKREDFQYLDLRDFSISKETIESWPLEINLIKNLSPQLIISFQCRFQISNDLEMELNTNNEVSIFFSNIDSQYCWINKNQLLEVLGRQQINIEKNELDLLLSIFNENLNLFIESSSAKPQLQKNMSEKIIELLRERRFPYLVEKIHFLDEPPNEGSAL